MLEHDLRITMNCPTHLLSLGKQKHCSPFLLIVESVSGVGEYFTNFEASAVIHLKEGDTSATSDVWHIKKLDSFESLDTWRLDLVSIEGLKVV